MASKGLRATSYQGTHSFEAVTNLRIPLKPLLAILCVVGWALFTFKPNCVFFVNCIINHFFNIFF